MDKITINGEEYEIETGKDLVEKFNEVVKELGFENLMIEE